LFGGRGRGGVGAPLPPRHLARRTARCPMAAVPAVGRRRAGVGSGAVAVQGTSSWCTERAACRCRERPRARCRLPGPAGAGASVGGRWPRAAERGPTASWPRSVDAGCAQEAPQDGQPGRCAAADPQASLGRTEYSPHSGDAFAAAPPGRQDGCVRLPSFTNPLELAIPRLPPTTKRVPPQRSTPKPLRRYRPPAAHRDVPCRHLVPVCVGATGDGSRPLGGGTVRPAVPLRASPPRGAAAAPPPRRAPAHGWSP
jgi:hypothetical protein